ncbi:hypothetical protein L7F22_066325 [Adiantum nelumboides]|nr:hypothetical protein [Adiantum nelumboides]
MATLPAPHIEAPLDASFAFSKLLVKSLPKNLLQSEVLNLDSAKKIAPQHLLVHSVEVTKPDSAIEKQELDPKSSQEEHATEPPRLTDVQASTSPVRSDALCNTHEKLESTTVPVDTEVQELGIGSLSRRREVSSEAHVQKILPDHKLGGTTSSLDTAAPIEFVKEAATILGEKLDSKLQMQVLEEERAASGFDMLKANKQLLHLKEKIATEEASVVNVLHELGKTKEQIRLCKGEVPVTSLGEGNSSPPSQPQAVSNESVAKESHEDVLREVEVTEKEIEFVLHRRAELERVKQSALRECEAAMNAEGDASTRVQKLVKEHDSIQESLTALKEALTGTEADITVLRSIPKIKFEGKSGVEPVQLSCARITSLKSLKLPVTNADTSMETLMRDLSTIRGVQISKAECELLGAKVRLDQARIVEGNCVAALGSVLEQLDETKSNLKKAIDEGDFLATTISALQTEVSRRQAELESAHETEQIACATLASLQDELCSVRAKVLSAQAGETKAREAKRSLPAAIKQLAIETDEAKAVSKVAREEARKGRLEIEQAKAGLSTTVCRLQAAQKEGEALRASEAMALAWLKALSEAEGETGDKTRITIPLEEYRALHDTGLQAEGSADKKVAAIFVEIDTATAREQEAQGKLDVTLKDLAVLLKAMEEAQKKAEEAQAAKLSVEAELRKWRAEHEQWRKTGSNPSSVSTSAAQSPRVANGKNSQGRLVAQSFHGRTVTGLDSLAEVFTLKVPSSEKAANVLPDMEWPKKSGKANKRSIFARLMSLLVRKPRKTVR